MKHGDEGIVHADGSITLFGRLPDSPARGCSLTVEAVDRHFKSSAQLPTDHKGSVRQIAKSHDRPLKIEQVIRALERMVNHPNQKQWTQGISIENAQWGLTHCIQSITQSGLHECLDGGIRPDKITVVVSHGVFVSGLEWIALAAASGAEVCIKAPKNGAQICIDFANELDAEGLKTSVTVTHDLGSPDWIIAFGGDETIQTLHEHYPSTPIQSYGHRFSFAVVDAIHCDVKALARSVLAYDTRGCMAPVACFVLNHTSDFDRLLMNALHEDTLRFPKGASEPYLGPELRRRQGLARIYGCQSKGAGFEVLTLPHRSFSQALCPEPLCSIQLRT